MGAAMKMRAAFQAGVKWSGVGATAFGVMLLLFVAAYPLGLVRAYPAPPSFAVDGRLGLQKRITDPKSLDRGPGEDLTGYLSRLTESVAVGMTHYWTGGDAWSEADIPYTAISVYDNYLLWLQGLLPAYRDNLRNYEFLTPAKAIARGYGFCSQVSKLVYSILREQGIDSQILSNPLHTVVEADGSVLDPDYGVFIPHSMAWIRAHPAALDGYYAAFPMDLASLRQAYAQEWHPLGSAAAFDQVRRYEARFDRLKWLPPAAITLFGVSLLLLGAWLGRWRRSSILPGPRPGWISAPGHATGERVQTAAGKPS